MQKDLFGNIIDPVTGPSKKISWSYSKMQSFRDCPRRYYYHYYGSKKRVAKAEPLKEKLAALSKLSNRYMFQGQVIHLVISTFLKKQKVFEIWDENRLLSFAEKVINETINYNQRIANGASIAVSTFQMTLLKEIQENIIDVEQLRAEVIAVARTCLHNFFSNPEFDHLRKGATLVNAKIEGDTSFSLSDRVEVDGKLDLAFWSDGVLFVADWKTGKKEMQDTSLQLLVYVLWAKALKEKSFTEVAIQKAYLQENSLERLEYSELHIDRARARILQDADMLLEMHPFGVEGVSDAFTRYVGKNCALCPFEKSCH
jgi:hypothetical protein